MNLITCSQDCIHQKDGYCRLEHAAPVSKVPVDGCFYYQKLSLEKKDAAVKN